jgi:hypothetical protein
LSGLQWGGLAVAYLPCGWRGHRGHATCTLLTGSTPRRPWP